MELFVRLGYDQFSMRSLAKDLRCSHATPYRYFKDKAELFAVVRAEGFRRFAEFLQTRLNQLPVGAATASQRPEERSLRALAQAYCDFSTVQPAAFTVIFEIGQPSPEQYPFVNEAGFDAWSVLFRTVKAAVEAEVVVGDPDLLAHTFWAAIHGISSLRLAGKLTVGRNAQEILDAMIDALIAAHRPQQLFEPNSPTLTNDARNSDS